MTTTGLAERRALVSGGSRGLGLEVTRALATAGCRVATFSRRASPEIEALVAAHPGRVHFRQGDVGEVDGLRDVVKWAEQALGGIDFLVNNAGVLHEALLGRQSPERIDQIIDVNLRGTLTLTRHAIRGMMVHGFGRVVSISSIVSVRGFKGTVAYSASKGAIDAMTRALAKELGGRNITVNSVAPGYLETDMTKEMGEEHLAKIKRRTPLGRLGTVEDVASVVTFLLSDQARFITGQTLVVDGGLTC